MRWSDTRGEVVEATKTMIDMICDGVAAFFGPENSCAVEAIVAQSRNIPMFSYVSTSASFFPPSNANDFSWKKKRKKIQIFPPNRRREGKTLGLQQVCQDRP